jgi:outer membrane protein assembly factor BamB
MKFCRYCGYKVPDDAMFCGNCGKSFTLPMQEPTSISKNSQSTPPNGEKVDDESNRRGPAPFMPLPEQSSGSAVPHVQGIPQVGTVPSVSSQVAGVTAKAGMSALVKFIIVAASCAVVIVGTVKAVPVLLQRGSNTSGNPVHKTTHPILAHSPTPSLSQLNVYVSSQDGNIYAFNASNGSQRWKYPTGSSTISQLKLADGIIYFVKEEDINSNPNATSTMYALNAQNGTVLHHYKLPYFTLETGGYIPPFAVSNGIIYFSAPPMAFAINSNDGTMLWQYSWFGRGASDPVIVNNVVCYVSGVGTIYSFQSKNGKLLWKYDLGPDATVPGSIMGTYPTPEIINNVLYVVGWLTGNLYAINLDTHTIRWHIHLNNEQAGTLFAMNDTLYVNTSAYPSRINTLYALRADNGQQLWSKKNFFIKFTSNNELYATDVDTNGFPTNNLYALSSSDASILWHLQMSASILGYMAIVYTNFYLITDTALYALHTTDGKILWQIPLSYGYMIGP